MGGKAFWQVRYWRQVILLLGFGSLLYLAHLQYGLGSVVEQSKRPSGTTALPHGGGHEKKLFQALNLNERQCEATFPGLTKDIQDSVALGAFPLKQARDMGPLQARIKDGQLYILHWEDKEILADNFLDVRRPAQPVSTSRRPA